MTLRHPGTLYLVPTGLGSLDPLPLLPPTTVETARRLRHFFAENPKTARAYLKAISHPLALRDIAIEALDEHTPRTRITELLQPLHTGIDCGLMSEAGCPAVADPGAALVYGCHAAGIRVIPLVGPSALLLALMGSGLNGQHYVFHGYLPAERDARVRRLKALEKQAEATRATQLFIEAPYRNDAMLDAIIASCRADTLLCVATDLTLPTESIRTQPVSRWHKMRPPIDRKPTVFLLYRGPERLAQKR